ncbi:MAG: stage II sporulation protein R, partial [Clostridium sp.]|nr:stage II sporulation protein R [Clostridium sp.]
MRLIAAACAAAVIGMQGAAGAARAEAMGGGILRLHIMANSDSAADQRAKLAVRDAVLEAMGG